MKKVVTWIVFFCLLLTVQAGFAENTVSDISLTVTDYSGVYDGQAHEGSASVSAQDAVISYSLDDGQTWSETKPQITNAGIVSFRVRAEVSGAEPVYAEGTLTVMPLDVTVVITGNHASSIYDGKKHTVSGYDVSSSSDLYTASDITFTGSAEISRIAVGTSDMGLAADQFENQNPNFHAVFDVKDGYIEITAVDEVVVRITGHSSSANFDGREHRVSGFDVEISNPLYKETFFDFLGVSEAKRTDIGISYMGLSEQDFVNISSRFSKVTFLVTDGFVEVTPGKKSAVKALINSEQFRGDLGAPKDLEQKTLTLMAVIKNDQVEYPSDPMNVDMRYFTQVPNLQVSFMFKDPLPLLTGGNYSVEIYGLPDEMYGTGSPEGFSDSIKNLYYLTNEAWINAAGDIEVELLWTKELNYTEEKSDYLEDSIGMYFITAEGEKEYVMFQTYAICMSYLGNEELCSSNDRTFNK